MFDIGFFEIVVVGIVALVVLGPERLPGTIRTVSLWIGRLRRSFNSIKADIEKEIGADEIRRTLRNEEIMEKFRHTQSQVQNSISSIKKETEQFKKNIDLEAQVASFTGSPGATANTTIAPAPAATVERTTTATSAASPAGEASTPTTDNSDGSSGTASSTPAQAGDSAQTETPKP